MRKLIRDKGWKYEKNSDDQQLLVTSSHPYHHSCIAFVQRDSDEKWRVTTNFLFISAVMLAVYSGKRIRTCRWVSFLICHKPSVPVCVLHFARQTVCFGLWRTSPSPEWLPARRWFLLRRRCLEWYIGSYMSWLVNDDSCFVLIQLL